MTMDDMPGNGQESKVPVVTEDRGKVVANSRDVASYFKKDHKGVLRSVRHLIAKRPDLGRRNFAPTEWVDAQGKANPSYEMDKRGFTLLAMGFTGDEALEFKLRYIERFEQMEEALRTGPSIEGLSAGNEARTFSRRTATEWVAACRVLDKYEQMFPGNPEVIRWAAKEICGMEMPPANILERARQGNLFEAAE